MFLILICLFCVINVPHFGIDKIAIANAVSYKTAQHWILTDAPLRYDKSIVVESRRNYNYIHRKTYMNMFSIL